MIGTRGYLFTFHLSLLTCLLLAQSGCNEPFRPIQDNDEYTFSIYGYLDASADTQWVRVIPARKQLDMLEVVPEMNVTLEHLESGYTEVMNDSLIRLSQGFKALNMWTTMDIKPDQSYRLRAERPDGAESHAKVTIPGDFPTPLLITNKNGLSGDLLIKVWNVWPMFNRFGV